MNDQPEDLAAAAGAEQAEPSAHQQGRLRAIDGLLFTEFGQGRGTAGERAMAHLRSQAAPREPAPASTSTSRLARASAPAQRAPGSRSGLRRQAYRRLGWGRLLRNPSAWSAGAAAVLVTAALVAVATRMVHPGDQDAVIESLSGVVMLGGDEEARIAGRGDVLSTGMTLATGAQSTARLRFRDGTVFDVTANARVRNVDAAAPDGAQKSLRLDAGAVHAEVAKQPGGRPLLVTTADAQAVVVGTRLVVTARTGATRLNVEQGLVRLVRSSDHRQVEVPAGKRVVAEQSGALIVQDSAFPAMTTVSPARPPVDGTGSGLRGDYFNTMTFTEPVLSRLDPQVNFDWGFQSSPDPRIKNEFYSVRWTGSIEPRFSEEYCLSTLSDDGVRVWIDGKLIMENWFEHPELWQSAFVAMEAGKRHPIVVEFCEWRRYSLVHLYWQSRHQPRELIPACQLYPPAAASTP